MKPKTVIVITHPELEVWVDLKSWCKSKGFIYQTLANKKLLPTLEISPRLINGYTVYRIAVK
jgi:hypothetical protein